MNRKQKIAVVIGAAVIVAVGALPWSGREIRLYDDHEVVVEWGPDYPLLVGSLLTALALTLAAVLVLRDREPRSRDPSAMAERGPGEDMMVTDELDVEDVRGTVKMIREAVSYLAVSPSQQRELFATADPRRGQPDSPDELALGLDDFWAPNAEIAEYLDRHVVGLLNRLDGLLDEMSGRKKAHLWEVSALDGPEWAEVRRIARLALDALDAI